MQCYKHTKYDMHIIKIHFHHQVWVMCFICNLPLLFITKIYRQIFFNLWMKTNTIFSISFNLISINLMFHIALEKFWIVQDFNFISCFSKINNYLSRTYLFYFNDNNSKWQDIQICTTENTCRNKKRKNTNVDAVAQSVESMDFISTTTPF